jgi:hypothetical protein
VPPAGTLVSYACSMRNSIFSKDKASQDVANWNALRTEYSSTTNGTTSRMLLRLSVVMFCALALYLYAGLGISLAVLVAGWFVFYRS